MERESIVKRISYLESELASSNHFDGYVSAGMDKELQKLKITLKWLDSGLLSGVLSDANIPNVAELFENQEKMLSDNDPPHIQVIKNKPNGTY